MEEIEMEDSVDKQVADINSSYKKESTCSCQVHWLNICIVQEDSSSCVSPNYVSAIWQDERHPHGLAD